MVWTITSPRNQVKRKRILTPFPEDAILLEVKHGPYTGVDEKERL
jgi:hypothetical protein